MKYDDGAFIGQVAMDLIGLIEEQTDGEVELTAVQITLVFNDDGKTRIFTTAQEVE